MYKMYKNVQFSWYQFVYKNNDSTSRVHNSHIWSLLTQMPAIRSSNSRGCFVANGCLSREIETSRLWVVSKYEFYIMSSQTAQPPCIKFYRMVCGSRWDWLSAAKYFVQNCTKLYKCAQPRCRALKIIFFDEIIFYFTFCRRKTNCTKLN